MASWLNKSSHRVLVLIVVAAGVVGSMAVYRTHTPAAVGSWLGGAAVSNTAPLSDNEVAPLLAQNRAMEDVAQRVTPAVVNIAVTARETNADTENDPFQQFFGQFFGRNMPQRPRIEHGVGSGAIISPDGYIVTNNHVVEGATQIRVTMNSRQQYDGRVVGTDPLTDIAVVKINAGNNLPNVPWGDSTVLKPGETVMAFGNPFGQNFTVTRGIISALNRNRLDASNPLARGAYIQTDAAINPGNSGGPLVNVRGEIIGIDTAILSPSGAFAGVGLAVPSNLAHNTVDALVKYGKVTRGYIGVSITDLDPAVAKKLGMNVLKGALVSQVQPDTPGARAGLRVYDVITKLNGQSIDSADQLQISVGEQAPGSTAHLEVIRNGKPMTVNVTLGTMPTNVAGREQPTSATESGGAKLGVHVTDITPEIRQQLELPNNVHGAVVEEVEPGGPGDNASPFPIQRGDVIQEINRHPVNNAAELQSQLRNAPKGQDMLVLLYRNGANFIAVVRPSSETGPGSSSRRPQPQPTEPEEQQPQ